MKITLTRKPRTPDQSWLSTWTALQGFLLTGVGVLAAAFQQWAAGALFFALGVSAFLYARRKFGPGARDG